MQFTENMSKAKLNLYIRRVVFVLVIFFVAMLQNTPHLFPTIFGSHAFLLIPLVVCIAMFERDLASTLMGIFAGALWDVSAAWGDGFNAIFLMLIATIVGLLINYLMRNNLSSAMLLGGVSIIAYTIIHWFIFIVCRGIDGAFKLLLTFYLPSAIYTFLFVPVFYIIMRSFLQKLKEYYPHRSQIRRP